MTPRPASGFYLGRLFDLASGKTGEAALHYDPDDLTTHAVIVGMTGSGKTGLGVGLLEEAALAGLPALVIDPKGDLANLLLRFPNLAPEDFLPWVDPEEARRSRQTPEALAEKTASAWREGLASWGLGSEQIARLLEAVETVIYTPGSDAARPLSILASLNAPEPSVRDDRDLLRDRVGGTARALLGLVGIEADPVRSREHILLANLFEHAWQSGADLDLASLIGQVQRPPFERLGALDLEQAFPESARAELANRLNNLLASPGFRAWLEGDALDIPALLWGPDGRPRHTVFYLAHLPEAEKQFFVTLLLTAVDTWMRGQPGTGSLRALLFFDEVYGYLPPVANPPPKDALLRLLKQARAFGLGLVLATQNPVDLDYKALSNAGTWFVGKLQTERDKARLLDGLEGAAGGVDRRAADKALAGLKPRVFLLHNVHARGLQTFQTRWAMTYLRGPITREQLRTFRPEAAAPAPAARAAQFAPPPAAPAAPAAGGRPAPPAGVADYILPNDRTAAQALERAGRAGRDARTLGLVYRPALLAQAGARLLDRKLNIDIERTLAALVLEPDRRGVVRWEQHPAEPLQAAALGGSPAPESAFAPLEAPLADAKILARLQKDFQDWAYRSAEARIQVNPALKLAAAPDASGESFRAQCAEAARAASEAEAEKLRLRYERQLTTLRNRLTREQRELEDDRAQHAARKLEEAATHGENILGLIGGRRRRLSTSLTKRRLTEKAKAQVDESVGAIADLERQIAALEAQREQELKTLHDAWAERALQIEESALRPRKTDVHLDLFGVAWVPFWRLESGGETFELPGSAAAEPPG